jgi:hypothetical protein
MISVTSAIIEPREREREEAQQLCVLHFCICSVLQHTNYEAGKQF